MDFCSEAAVKSKSDAIKEDCLKHPFYVFDRKNPWSRQTAQTNEKNNYLKNSDDVQK